MTSLRVRYVRLTEVSFSHVTVSRVTKLAATLGHKLLSAAEEHSEIYVSPFPAFLTRFILPPRQYSVGFSTNQFRSVCYDEFAQLGFALLQQYMKLCFMIVRREFCAL